MNKEEAFALGEEIEARSPRLNVIPAYDSQFGYHLRVQIDGAHGFTVFGPSDWHDQLRSAEAEAEWAQRRSLGK